MNDLKSQALAYHKKGPGKLRTEAMEPLTGKADLRLAYTPGVGEVSTAVATGEVGVNEVTARGNTVAIVSDGSAVLGLGNIGPEAAMPVMEGKAVLFKEFAGINGVPICLATQDTEEIIRIVKALEPTFGGINLEDIAAPRCFEIEARLKAEMGIPVFHDDQHGTAIVVLAGLINALKLAEKQLEDVRIVISGAGAAGMAITKILLARGARDIVVLDSKGAICDLSDLSSPSKAEIRGLTNPRNVCGTLSEVIAGADVFIGVSAPGLLTTEMVATMASRAIVFALANPVPEILPDAAKAGGAFIVATGRSDFPNQVNNVLAFPGVFKGAFETGATQITEAMKVAAAEALANHITPTQDQILPEVFDKSVVPKVVAAIRALS